MKIPISCPGCGAKYQIDQSKAGAKLKCRKCETVFAAQPRTAQSGQPSRTAVQAAAGPASRPPSQADSPTRSATSQPAAPAGHTRCPECFEFIPTEQLQSHREQHRGKAEDGQYNHYPTLPPEKQFQGPLTDVPRNYLHRKCGAVTGMPEPIIRTYLVNPFFYGYSSFCCGCNKHVPVKELVWTETKQNVMEYYRELQKPFSFFCKERMGVVGTMLGVAAVGGLLLAGAVFVIAKFVLALESGLLLAGIVFLVATLVFIGLLLSMRGGL